MTDRSRSLRLFVAVYPPPATARSLLTKLDGLDLPEHRAVPEAQVHLTLQFIGDTPVARLDETIESVRRSTGGIGAFDLSLRRLITLPRRPPARLVAAEADAPAPLLELHRRLVVRLARHARREAADRFTPHFTLCRFRSPRRIPPLDVALDAPPFPVERIVLMRSTLDPSGAQHHETAAFPLGQG